MAGSLARIDGATSNDASHCRFCDDESRKDRFDPEEQCRGADLLGDVFASILPTLSRTAPLRIAAISALRRVIMHSPNREYTRLATSVFGDFYLHSMRSSIRELRITAGYVLLGLCGLAVGVDDVSSFSITSFVQRNLDRSVRHDNFIRILDWLRGIAEKKDIYYHESCILTVCRLAM